MSRIFISHASSAAAVANRFKILVEGDSVAVDAFLSSDSDSIQAGTLWTPEIENQLQRCSHFIALIDNASDSRVPWICYEVGYARGRGLLPKIFVFGGVDPRDISMPLASIHFVGTWDTNRWSAQLQNMNVKVDAQKLNQLAELFRQIPEAQQ